MVRVTSRRMLNAFGVTPPTAWTPPAMLALTVATYAVAFGWVFMFFFLGGPSPALRKCLTDPAMWGLSVLDWISVANLGWALVLVTDAVVKIVARSFGTSGKLRAVFLAVMGLGIVVAMQLAVEALRSMATATP